MPKNRIPLLVVAARSKVLVPIVTPCRTSTLPQNLTPVVMRCWSDPSRLYVSSAPFLSLPMISDCAGAVGWTQIAGSSAARRCA